MEFLKFIKRTFSTELILISMSLGIVIATFINSHIVLSFGVCDPVERFAAGFILTIPEILCICLCIAIIKGAIALAKFISATYFLYKIENKIEKLGTTDTKAKEKIIKELFANIPFWKAKMILNDISLSTEFKRFRIEQDLFTRIRKEEDLMFVLTANVISFK